jgi:Coenzyme PQQ synthesis protein D (PqqD)
MQLAKYVKFREEKFGGVLFETRSEKVFTLSPTATAVVREIERGGGEREIAMRLKDRFHDPDGAIEREVAAFLADLREKGLVED